MGRQKTSFMILCTIAQTAQHPHETYVAAAYPSLEMRSKNVVVNVPYCQEVREEEPPVLWSSKHVAFLVLSCLYHSSYKLENYLHHNFVSSWALPLCPPPHHLSDYLSSRVFTVKNNMKVDTSFLVILQFLLGSIHYYGEILVITDTA